MSELPKLLLFEDEIRNAKLIKAACKKYFDITWAKNEEMLDDEISEEFDVIVSDIRIRGTDVRGHMIIEDLRRKYKISRIPVIIYSGIVNVFEIEKERGRLFFGYIDKGDEDFAEQLVQKAIEASLEKENITSHRYFETRFKDMNKIDETLITSDVINHLSFITDTSQLKTVKDLINQMYKDDMEEDILDPLEDLAWSYIKKFEK